MSPHYIDIPEVWAARIVMYVKYVHQQNIFERLMCYFVLLINPQIYNQA